MALSTLLRSLKYRGGCVTMAHAHQRGMSAFATTFGLIDWISGNWPRRTGKDAPWKRLWNTYPNLDVQVIKALQRWKALSFLPVFWDCICICPCKVYMRNIIEYWDGPRIIPYLKFCWPSKNPASNCDCSWLGFIGVAPRRDPLVVLYSIAPLTYLPNKTKVLSSKICLLHFSSKL